MPDRIIRDEILNSDRWLDLPNDTDRLCYCPALLLLCDDFGNLEGGLRRLFRIFQRFTQIKTEESAATTLLHLCEHDLARRYEVEKREFYHLPRTRPQRKYLVRKCPASPWDMSGTCMLGKEQRVLKQGLAKNMLDISPTHALHMLQVGVGVGVGVEENLKPKATSQPALHEPAPVDNSRKSKPTDKSVFKQNPIQPLETLEEYGARIAALTIGLTSEKP